MPQVKYICLTLLVVMVSAKAQSGDMGMPDFNKISAQSRHNVQGTGDSTAVVIEGVPDGDFGIRWDFQMRAMAILLQFRGVEVSMEELLAVSGDAFSLCHASHWQGYAYLCVPTNPVQNLAEAYGFEYGTTHAGQTGAILTGKTLEERAILAGLALKRIREEIEAGRPVLISGAEAHCGKASLVVGYQEHGDLLCHVGDGDPYRWTPVRGVAEKGVDAAFGVMDGRCRGMVRGGFFGGWQANPAYLIGARTNALDGRTRVLVALRRAVALASAPPFHRRNWGGVDYYFGYEAYEQWALALEALDYPTDLDGPFNTNGVEEASDWYEMGNMDTQVDQVVTGRSAAASFCRAAAKLLGEEAGEKLVEAAEAYEAEVFTAKRAFDPFIPRFDGNDARREAWLGSEEMRLAGARAVRKMLALERSAVAAIGRALASLNEGGKTMGAVLLETDRLVLRGFVTDDWPYLHVLAKDWAKAPGPAFDKWPVSEEGARGLAGHFAERQKFLAMCRKGDNRVIGLIGLNGIEAETGMFDLGHVILSDCQDGDLDREALQAAVDHIFEIEDVGNIVTHNDPTHEEQLRPLLLIGFAPKEGGEKGALMLARTRWEGKQGR